jgi:hypothetical protein
VKTTNLFVELRRRNVIRVAGLYLVGDSRFQKLCRGLDK